MCDQDEITEENGTLNVFDDGHTSKKDQTSDKPGRINRNFSNTRFCQRRVIILAILFVLTMATVIGLSIGLGLCRKSTSCADEQQPSINKSKCPDFLKQLKDPSFDFYLLNEPFCQSPFPSVESTFFIKCFLPYDGEYIIQSLVIGNGQVTRICGTDGKYHFQLQCDQPPSGTCNSFCDKNCGNFKFNITTRNVVLIEMTKSCSSPGGEISIWNSTGHSGRKKIQNP